MFFPRLFAETQNARISCCASSRSMLTSTFVFFVIVCFLSLLGVYNKSLVLSATIPGDRRDASQVPDNIWENNEFCGESKGNICQHTNSLTQQKVPKQPITGIMAS